MLEYKKILVPIDGSANSEWALKKSNFGGSAEPWTFRRGYRYSVLTFYGYLWAYGY